MGYLKTPRQFARVMLNTPADRAIDRGGNEIRTRTDIRMTLSNRRQLQQLALYSSVTTRRRFRHGSGCPSECVYTSGDDQYDQTGHRHECDVL